MTTRAPTVQMNNILVLLHLSPQQSMSLLSSVCRWRAMTIFTYNCQDCQQSCFNVPPQAVHVLRQVVAHLTKWNICFRGSHWELLNRKVIFEAWTSDQTSKTDKYEVWVIFEAWTSEWVYHRKELEELASPPPPHRLVSSPQLVLPGEELLFTCTGWVEWAGRDIF